MNSLELRKFLEFGLSEQDPSIIKSVIQMAMQEGISTSELMELNDLHLSLILILAAPKKENRGRHKDPKAERLILFLNFACIVKSNLINKSFSKTWEEFSDSTTRPIKSKNELWRCAGILLLLQQNNDRDASIAIRRFKLTKKDLRSCE